MREQAVVGRLAPSPSGRMHLGNAFSALMSYLAARSAGGKLILRLEDLDPDRCRMEFCGGVEEDFRWLGLDWDEGGSAGGEHYFQHARREVYAHYLSCLEQAKLTYPCFCTRGELRAACAPHRGDGEAVYPGTCRELTEERRAALARVRRPALRVRVPEETVSFCDRVMGCCAQSLARDCGDFVVRRSDGVCAYQLAVVVDDALMGVNQVVRGGDLLSSTPRQIWLGRVLGFPEIAEYAHLPLLLAADGRRLAKRDGDLTLAALRARGIRPEAVVGRLACWAGLLEKPEPVSARELIPEFRWDRLRRDDVTVGEI